MLRLSAHARRRFVRLAAVPLAALVAMACGSTVTPAPTAGPTVGPGTTSGPSSGLSSGPSASFTAPVASATSRATPSAVPTNVPSAAPTTTVSATPPPTATAPAPTPGAAPSPSAAFACGYPVERAATRSDPVALISDVRVGAHDAYDRVVVEFLGSGTPRLRLERVSPPFVKDPSGLPLTVTGTSFVRILLFAASGAGYATPTGQPSYTGTSAFTPGYVRLTSLVQAGDFEGITTWYAGFTGPMCYQVSELSSPARLVIDVRAP